MYEMKITAWWHRDLRQLLGNYCLTTISAGCYLLQHNTGHKQFPAEVIKKKKNISLNPHHLRPCSFPAPVSAWCEALEAELVVGPREKSVSGEKNSSRGGEDELCALQEAADAAELPSASLPAPPNQGDVAGC